ncbi:MAG: RNA polymerase sigma factor RpoD/SigA [Ruminococcaceae bacterium]|nr:RNA polymerase sigma factor RpoD/SigA [Oscillospiraceae bacterium]
MAIDTRQHHTPAETGLSTYLEQISRYPRLSAREEQETAQAIAAGDGAALRRMITGNLRLVVAVAREYEGRGVALMDLIQEGNIGLMVAARKYDGQLGYRFSTYATKWIRQGITRCLMQHAGLIRVPVHTARQLRKLLEIKARYLQQQSSEPDPETLAEHSGIPVNRVKKLLQIIPEVCSLDAPAGEDNGTTLGQLLPEKSTHDPLESMIQAQLLELMDRLMGQLTPRQQTILRLHFGMEDGNCHPLEEIAGLLGISKERVRQIEQQAFKKMKALGEELGLADFLF